MSIDYTSASAKRLALALFRRNCEDLGLIRPDAALAHAQPPHSPVQSAKIVGEVSKPNAAEHK